MESTALLDPTALLAGMPTIEAVRDLESRLLQLPQAPHAELDVGGPVGFVESPTGGIDGVARVAHRGVVLWTISWFGCHTNVL